MAAQKEFHTEQELPFDLLSDPGGGLAKRFGLLMDRAPFAKRITLIVDPKGILRRIDDRVNVRSHGKDVVAMVRELQQSQGSGAADDGG